MPLEIERLYTWTDTEVSEILSRAQQCVDIAGISEANSEVAFAKAIQMLSHHNAIPRESGIAVARQVLND